MTTTADTDRQQMAGQAEDASSERQSGTVRAFLARRDPYAWLIGALVLVLGSVFVGVDLAYNQGKLIAPIDDAYIHLQYGKQLGSGHPFQYNSGDPISTGASSLLYAFVLGAGYAVGFHGNLLLWFAVVLGVGCLAVTAVFTYRLGRLFLGRAVGVWAGGLVAVSGPLLWGAVSGMEVGLTALLLTASVLAFAQERSRGRFVLTPLVGVLLALVRPEGLFFMVMLCGAMLWTVFGARRAGRISSRTTLGSVALVLLPPAAGAGQYLFYKIATGTFSANGVQSKSHLSDQPMFYLGDFIDRTVAHVRALIDFFTGLGNTDFAFPGALLLFVIGLVYLMAASVEWRPLLLAIGGGITLAVLSASTLNTALVHELRYFQPFLPLFLLLAVCGVYAVTRVAARARVRRLALHTVLVVLLLFPLVALPTWAVRLGREAATIRDTDVSVAAWISENLPPDAIVGVKDVGAIAYFGERRVVDTIGLATNEIAAASNNGTGSLYEALRKMSPEERPDYFAVYEPQPGASMQAFVETGIFEPDPVAVFPVRAAPDLDGNRIVPFSDTTVYRADWRLAGSGDHAPVSGKVRDYLNVGDLDSEDAHGYEVHMTQPGLQPYTMLRRQDDVIDSGRAIVGGEEFTVENLTPGEPLTIATRILVTGSEDVRVLVDGQDAGIWSFPAEDGEWVVDEFTIDGDLVTSPTVRLEIEPVQPLLNPYPEYTSFGYWFVQ